MRKSAIFCALLRRDLHLLKNNFRQLITDGFFLVCVQVVSFGYLLPLAGMPQAYIPAIFLGTLTRIFFFYGFGDCLKIVFDLKNNRIIDYQMTLPFSRKWLLAEYIVAFMLSSIIVTLPLITIGIVLLGPNFPLDHVRIFLFGITYVLINFFYGLLFTYFGFNTDSTWLLDNLWPRRLTPLFLLGCSFASWKTIYHLNSFFGLLFLLNPITYINEAMRATLLPQEEFIPLWISLLVICLCSIIVSVMLLKAFDKRLDPVIKESA